MRNTFLSEQLKLRTRRQIDIGEENELLEIEISSSNLNEFEELSALEDLEKAMVSILKKEEIELMQLYLNGLKYDELADVFDIPIGTVKGRIFICKDKLKAYFENKPYISLYKKNPKNHVN